MWDLTNEAYGESAQAKPYFYLFYDSSIAPLAPGYRDAYYKLGVTSGPEFLFVIVDDPQDNRVRDALKDHEGGRELYARIREAIPCFVFVNGRLELTQRLQDARIHPIRDFDKDIDVLYDALGRHPPTTLIRVVQYLRFANKLFDVKVPGFHLNVLVDKLIDRVDPEKIPDRPDHR